MALMTVQPAASQRPVTNRNVGGYYGNPGREGAFLVVLRGLEISWKGGYIGH